MFKSNKRKYDKLQQGYNKLKESEAQKKKKPLQKLQQQDEEWVTDEENNNNHNDNQKQEDIEFEDEFDDEFEDEIEVDNGSNNSSISEMQVEQEETKLNPQEQDSDYVDVLPSKPSKPASKKKKIKTEAFLGTRNDLKEGEELQVDNHAYEFLHRANTEWPCLTFDFLLTEQQRCQTVFDNKYKYPIELYMVAGTSGASKGHLNQVYVLGMYNLFSTKNDDDSEEEDDDNEQEDTQPKLILHSIETKSSINRIKSWRNSGIVACWQENGDVCVYDLQKEFDLCRSKQKQNKQQQLMKKKNKSAYTPPQQLIKAFKNPTEGFGLAWQNSANALFATGDNTGKLTLYHGSQSGWERDYPLDLYKCSIEDIQFSKTDLNQLICCATDGSFCGVDLRKKGSNFIYKKAHSQDINVLDWNTSNQNLIATGSDDNLVKIWDLRMCKSTVKSPAVAEISFHKAPLTSLHWQPGEESSLVTASLDDRVAVWDFSVESEQIPTQEEKSKGIPEQLMFVHMGVENVREVQWHPVMRDAIVSTAANGFNAFRPAVGTDVSISEEEEEEEEDNKKIVKEIDLDKFLGQMKI